MHIISYLINHREKKRHQHQSHRLFPLLSIERYVYPRSPLTPLSTYSPARAHKHLSCVLSPLINSFGFRGHLALHLTLLGVHGMNRKLWALVGNTGVRVVVLAVGIASCMTNLTFSVGDEHVVVIDERDDIL